MFVCWLIDQAGVAQALLTLARIVENCGISGLIGYTLSSTTAPVLFKPPQPSRPQWLTGSGKASVDVIVRPSLTHRWWVWPIKRSICTLVLCFTHPLKQPRRFPTSLASNQLVVSTQRLSVEIWYNTIYAWSSMYGWMRQLSLGQLGKKRTSSQNGIECACWLSSQQVCERTTPTWTPIWIQQFFFFVKVLIKIFLLIRTVTSWPVQLLTLVGLLSGENLIKLECNRNCVFEVCLINIARVGVTAACWGLTDGHWTWPFGPGSCKWVAIWKRNSRQSNWFSGSGPSGELVLGREHAFHSCLVVSANDHK